MVEGGGEWWYLHTQRSLPMWQVRWDPCGEAPSAGSAPIDNADVGQWAWEEGRVWLGQWSFASMPQCKLEIEINYRKENQKLHHFITDS